MILKQKRQQLVARPIVRIRQNRNKQEISIPIADRKYVQAMIEFVVCAL